MKKQLIITGQNGSGKTILLDAVADYLNDITLGKEMNSREDLVIAYYQANCSFYIE